MPSVAVRLIVFASSVLAVAAWSARPCLAQAPQAMPPESTPPAAVPEPPPPAPPPPAARPPLVAAAPQPEPVGSGSDLDVEARRFAIGYSGFSQVPVGGTTADLTVPAVGVRYWTSPTVGLDLALGIGWAGGSTEAAGVSTDKNSVFGFILAGGVQLALATSRHVSFQVIPFLTFAHGSTSTGTGAAQTDFSGTRVDVGARAGLEIFFGFIGIPELALSATVGLQLDYRKVTSSTVGVNASTSDSTTSITTTVQNNPWDIFAGSVAARYYF